MFYRGVLTFLPDLLERLGALEPVAVGALVLEPGRYVYVGLLLVGVLGQYVGGRLTDRLPIERALAVALAALSAVAAGFFPLAQTGLAGLLLVSAALGLLLFGLQPLYQAAVADYTPPGAAGSLLRLQLPRRLRASARWGLALAGALLDAFGAQVTVLGAGGADGAGGPGGLGAGPPARGGNGPRPPACRRPTLMRGHSGPAPDLSGVHEVGERP